ncbi:MAG TPA: hypothetical protein VGJ31_12795 [Dongiaceae bacterium]
MTVKPWPFRDPPNLAVIVHRNIISGEKAIALVTHDVDDGGWQFLSDEIGPLNESDGMVVGLGQIVTRDPSLMTLANLPVGWRAWRPSKDAPWQRSKSRG